jgi:hypothetical protein
MEKETWIDEGCEGIPKIYTSKTEVLELIRGIISEDIDALETDEQTTDDRLFEIAYWHYSISKQ